MAIENTAVNDLIARVRGGGRPASSARMLATVPPMASAGSAQPACPATMPVAAPFEARPPALSAYPVTFGAPVLSSALPPSEGHAWAPPCDGPAAGASVPEWPQAERLVPTFQMRRPGSELRQVIGRLVLPIALLVSVGVVIGAYVGFAGDHGAPLTSHSAAASALVSARGITAPEAAPAAPAAAAAPAAPAAPANAPAAQALVDVRIDSTPSGATVMLVDRGRSQLVGNTPIDAAIDPSREYDLVFTAEDQPSHVEHLDPRTTRRIAVVLGQRADAHSSDSTPHRAERTGGSGSRRSSRAP